MQLRVEIAAGLVSLLALLCSTAALAQETNEKNSATAPSEVRGRYLGVAGWEITDGKTVLLIDPYLSRLLGPPADENPAPPGWPGKMGFDDLAVPDTAAVDRHIGRADYILLTHGHYVHLLDAPYIARTRKAVLIGNETAASVARAYGLASAQIITIRGGEDFDFGSFSVRVLPSLHSATRGKRYFSSGRPTVTAKGPLPFKDFVEGGTVGFLIRLGGIQILAFGSMNYIEREITGLRPDVVLVPADPLRREIYDYTGRLLRALGPPPLVIATHWDNSRRPYDEGVDVELKEANEFVAEVHAVSPKTHVIIPRHFEWVRFSDHPAR